MRILVFKIIEKKEIKKSYYSKEKVITEENDNDMSMEERRKKELLNKYRKYKSMNRDLIWKKQHRYIASFENNDNSEENNDNRKDVKENKNYKNINENNYKTNNINKKTYTENKSISKPVENKYSNNYNSNYNKTQGQKNIEIYEYKKVNEDNKYNKNNNIIQQSRKNKSENKDMEIKKNSYNITNKYIGNTQNTSTQKYTTVNKPNTSVNINVKNYTKDSKISQSNTNSIKIGPNYDYKKTEVTKTTISKEEFKPYISKNTTTKYESKGANNISKNYNTTVISSTNYQKDKDNNQNKTSNVNIYSSKYLNTEGNQKDKKIENKYVTKVEKKVEIKSSGNTDKNEQYEKRFLLRNPLLVQG